MKNTTIIGLIVLAVLAVAAVAGIVYLAPKPVAPIETPPELMPDAATTTPAAPEDAAIVPATGREIIGTSAGGNPIEAYHYGTGDTELLFVGGIHGAYEWNTSLLMYQFMDYLDANPAAVAANERVTIIPQLNPDGVQKIAGAAGRFSASDIPAGADTVPGRYNARGVDLNRNFDCDWQAQGTWQNHPVSGGTAAFSEPESQAVRAYVAAHQPKAAVVWYSAAGGVYSSNCHGGVLPETKALTDAFAQASGYPGHESFDFYAITGDMVNWLAKGNVPAISVLLSSHDSTEWEKNKAGITAVLARYAK